MRARLPACELAATLSTYLGIAAVGCVTEGAVYIRTVTGIFQSFAIGDEILFSRQLKLDICFQQRATVGAGFLPARIFRPATFAGPNQFDVSKLFLCHRRALPWQSTR
jgi:hypothetical protein